MVVIIDPPSGLPVPRRTDRAPRRGRKAIRIPGPGDIDQVPAGAARDPGLDVDPKAFGSGVGEAAADFGQAVARLSSPVDRMNRRNDEAFAAAGLAPLHERQSRAGLEARKDTSGGVAGFHDGRMATFDRDLGEVLERPPSTGAREILKRGLITLNEHDIWRHDTASETVRATARGNGRFIMDHVTIDLKNCYGIKYLQRDFDFSNTRAYAIYAPNGVMKSCLAQTFQDAADGKDSEDRIFKTRKTVRKIIDEAGQDISGRRILVVNPYDEQLGITEQTSTLLLAAIIHDGHRI